MRTKAFLSVSNQAIKLELEFLDQASFTEFNTLTLLVIFINACLSYRFFAYDFPVADISSGILSSNSPGFSNTEEVHTL